PTLARPSPQRFAHVLPWLGPTPYAVALNQTRGDWHRDAHADRARGVTALKPSARRSCAATYERGDCPGRASPQAGGMTPRPVWGPRSAPAAAPVRCGPA